MHEEFRILMMYFCVLQMAMTVTSEEFDRVPTDLLDSKYSTFIAPLIDQI